MSTRADDTIGFGDYEIMVAAGELRRLGQPIRLQPQPFKLLALLVTQAGVVVTREEIRRELWKEDTFVDFDQGVNFCIRQIREVLRDNAERPMFVQTIPKRGYRFIAPTRQPQGAGPDTKLMRAVWTNIAELKMADERRRTRRKALLIAGVMLAVLALLGFVWWRS